MSAPIIGKKDGGFNITPTWSRTRIVFTALCRYCARCSPSASISSRLIPQHGKSSKTYRSSSSFFSSLVYFAGFVYNSSKTSTGGVLSVSQVLSLRIPDRMAERLDRFARRQGNGMTRTKAGVMLLEESLREAEFALIEYRDSSIG